MRVARDAEVVRAADVDAGLEVVAADELRDVADQLPLRFVLVERAVAAIDPEARAEVEAAVTLDESGRQS